MLIISRLFPTLLLSVSSVISAPLSPRQSTSPSRFADGATAIKDLFNALSLELGSSTASRGNTTGTGVYYSVCNEANGGNITNVQAEPCEGGKGTQGNPCVFTAGRNYTVTITYTSPLDIDTPRAGLASYNGDQKSAYPGQSFKTEGVGCVSVYPLSGSVWGRKELYLPIQDFPSAFDRLVFNATAGVQGPSFLCVDIPIALASGQPV